MTAKDNPFTRLAAEVCGFGKNLEAGLCPFCGKEQKKEDLRDEISRKEFDITGLCQSCQDEIFG